MATLAQTTADLQNATQHLYSYMRMLYQVECKEWKPQDDGTHTHGNQAQAPTLIDYNALTLIEEVEDNLQDIYWMHKEPFSGTWRELLENIHTRAEEFAQDPNASRYINRIIQDANRVWNYINPQPPTDNARILTPSQIAELLNSAYHTHTNRKTIETKLRRGKVKAAKLDNGKWIISQLSIIQLAQQLPPQPPTNLNAAS